jgi:hypothetical protein
MPKEVRKPPAGPDKNAPARTAEEVQSVNLPGAGEVQVKILNAPPHPPGDKAIHSRRPLPAVPTRAQREKQDRNQGDPT